MGAANLVKKLVEIERSVGNVRAIEVHALVLEAQGYVLEMQRQMIDTLRENTCLRERMEKYEPTSPARMREARMPSNTEVARELARMHMPLTEEAVGQLHLAAS